MDFTAHPSSSDCSSLRSSDCSSLRLPSSAATPRRKKTSPLICSDNNDLSLSNNNEEGGAAIAAGSALYSSLRNNPSSPPPSPGSKNNNYHPSSSPRRDGSSNLDTLKDITYATNNNKNNNSSNNNNSSSNNNNNQDGDDLSVDNQDGDDVSMDNFTNLPTADGTTTHNERKRNFHEISSDADNIPVDKEVLLDDSPPVPSNQLDNHGEEISTICTNLERWLSTGAAAKLEMKTINEKIANKKATKKSQKEQLKQAKEMLDEANLSAVLELSLMHHLLFSSGKDEVAISEYIQRYFEFETRLVEQTATINEMSANIDDNDNEVIAFLSECFFDHSAITTAERNLDPSLDNAYNQIIRDRLMLLGRGVQNTIDADTFLNEWEDIDIREKMCVESIRCKKDLIIEKEVKDKETNEVLSTYNIVVIGKGESWHWHNMGGIKRDARGGVIMNYHPPSEGGVVDEDNGCVTANTRLLPTFVQRQSGGDLQDGKLTEEVKQSLDQHMKIFDYWTFFPMTKEYYLNEAELLAESGAFDINDLRLSGLLQVAGQIMLSSLRGQVFCFAVGHADVMRTSFSFSGAGISQYCCAVGPIPHGEPMNLPKVYMTRSTFSDKYLKRASIAANILFRSVPLMSISRSDSVFLKIAQRIPLTAAEEEFLSERRSANRIKPVAIRLLNDDEEEKEETVCILEARSDAADKLGVSVGRLRGYTDKETGIVSISGVPVCRLVNVDRAEYHRLAASQRGLADGGGSKLEGIRQTIQELSIRIKPVAIRLLNDDEEEKEETVCILEARSDAADKLGVGVRRLYKNTDKKTGIVAFYGVKVCRIKEVDRPTYHALAESERGVVDETGLEDI